MNFHKLHGAFWRICLFCVTNLWNELLASQGPKAPNTQLLAASESLFQDRLNYLRARRSECFFS